MEDLTYEKYPFLKELGLQKIKYGALIGGKFTAIGLVTYSISPSDKKVFHSIILENSGDSLRKR
jgi:hypothetical protein